MLQFHPLGDQGLQIVFANSINEQTVLQIKHLMKGLLDQRNLAITECVPAYTTLSIFYDSTKLSYHDLLKQVKKMSGDHKNIEIPDSWVIEIPTYYGGEFCPDLEQVAGHNNLSVEEVISIHSSKAYFIYMLGFSPGFPYLGGMSEKIATPRLANPRAKVAEGSVGIAGSQTGIYPVESPGGWQIIGRTPIKLYDAKRKKPILLEAGNYIRFRPIEQQMYEEIVEQIKKDGEFTITTYPYRSDKSYI